MEPMTLGTPNTSLNASAFETSNVSTSQFLPSFLLGGNESVNSSTCASSRLTSPTKQYPKSQFSGYSPVQTSVKDKARYSPPKVCSSADKYDGPPLLSLADCSVIRSTNQTSASLDINTIHDFSRDFIEEDAFDNWVTVFGFSPCHIELVISFFDRFGQVVDKKHSSNGGNWIHLKYSYRKEAQTALAHNGKLISSNLMVGVISRKEKHNLDSSKHSVGLQSKCNPIRYTNSTTPFSPTIRRFTTNFGDSEVLPATNVPTKSSGVFSKTMEYLFGW